MPSKVLGTTSIHGMSKERHVCLCTRVDKSFKGVDKRYMLERLFGISRPGRKSSLKFFFKQLHSTLIFSTFLWFLLLISVAQSREFGGVMEVEGKRSIGAIGWRCVGTIEGHNVI